MENQILDKKGVLVTPTRVLSTVPVGIHFTHGVESMFGTTTCALTHICKGSYLFISLRVHH